MRNDWMTDLTLRLRPNLADRPPAAQQFAAIALSTILLFAPLALIALAWLTAVTSWPLLREQALLFLFLMATTTLLSELQYVVVLQPDGETRINVTGSLAGMVYGSAALIFGPTALWISWLSSFGRALWQYRQLSRRQGSDAGWFAASQFVQENGVGLLISLVALAVYTALGGAFPIRAAPPDWLPALAAVLSQILQFLLLYLPAILLINQITRVPNSFRSVGQFWLGAFSLFAIYSPFAIPVALTYSLGSPGLYVIFTLAITLVNLLAYSLSRANMRNQARSRELDILEKLGQALLSSPADASALAAVMAQQLPRLFPGDRLAIRVFESDGAAWPSLDFQHPPRLPIADDAAWHRLQTAVSPLTIERRVTLPGDKAPFGDLFLVQIAAADLPCAGGVYLQRAQSLRRPEEVAPIVQALADQIGAALTRAQVHADTLARQKMAQELAVAGRIQATFLPAAVPQLPGWDVTATLIPARQTSGDFYDFMPLPDGRLGLLVADVADKGTGAALYMALSRTLIRTYAMQHPDAPGRALALANERILADTESDQFVTVFYAVLHPADGRLVYANAGHNPAYIVGGTVRALAQTGIPLGMFAGMAWRQAEVTLAPGDVLLLYTDGITEAQDAAQAEFGEERLLQAVRSANGRSAADLQAAVVSAVQAFVDGAPQFDDITLMIVRDARETSA